ncbi:hypothetical protein CP6013_00001 [Clostridium pasteurianum DSM 525 = ATCC 6013]|uniref:NADPH-dependent FMN reductase n=1 Tax=Clostridium pasteurianum DSM 525 = ATCC 6013 TaxID=1262449 RepID=A0A837S205_CLOPA|nr:hypothetical protein CP6013_00001 [Clostridium pasteurianum DSM 525 = ATCC 6013]
MKAIAVNGSPRKEWNTATLLKRTLDGAKSVGSRNRDDKSLQFKL